MPDYSIPAFQQPANADPLKMISTLAQVQQSQAHTGLYQLQAQEQARKLEGWEKAKTGDLTDWRLYDPAAVKTHEEGLRKSKEFSALDDNAAAAATGDPVARARLAAYPEAYKTVGEGQKEFTEADSKVLETKARIAQSYDGTSQGRINTIRMGQQAGLLDTSPLVVDNLMKLDDDQFRQKMQQWQRAGPSPQEFNKPVHKTPEQSIVTQGESAFGPMAPAGPRTPGPQTDLTGGAVTDPNLMRPTQVASLGPASMGKIYSNNEVSPLDPIGTKVAGPVAPLPPQIAKRWGDAEDPTLYHQKVEVGKDQAKSFKDSGEKYAAAGELQSRMALVDHHIETLGPNWMGAGIDAKANATKTFNSMINQYLPEGAKKFAINSDKVASWEDFQKETIRGGMELIKSNFGGSREAAAIIQMGTTAVPSASNTYQGAKLVSASIQQMLKREMELHEFKTARVEAGQSLTGADAAFNKANPTSKYAQNAVLAVVPEGAKAKLIAEPETAAAFDKKYGAGMPSLSKRILDETKPR